MFLKTTRAVCCICAWLKKSFKMNRLPTWLVTSYSMHIAWQTTSLFCVKYCYRLCCAEKDMGKIICFCLASCDSVSFPLRKGLCLKSSSCRWSGWSNSQSVSHWKLSSQNQISWANTHWNASQQQSKYITNDKYTFHFQILSI